MFTPPSNGQQIQQPSPSSTNPQTFRPPISQTHSESSATGIPQSPALSRRRTSSFGFNSNFFSNLTNSLRNSSSSSNLQTQATNNSQTGVGGNRSRAGSSSRLNLIQNFQSGNGSNNSIPRPSSSRNTSTINIPPSNQAYLINTDSINDNPDQMISSYVGTPTEDALQGQTRSNSLQAGAQLPQTMAQKLDSDGTYSIRLTPFIDHSSTTAGLYFAPVLRKAKPNSRLSIGRYTEKVRDAAQAPPGSSAPVVFKSKVVSRTHAEFYVDEFGNWYVRDLKSSSGTFLNHIRLSPAGVESMDTPIQNGDVLQLGMDFRGGVEDIFRCVKMRVEMNKSWQRKASQFNKEAHEKLRSLALLDEAEFSECAICLLKIKPCQSVFISPCSHCWHYKCIRPIVVKSYPQFLCPNCRETCDLEADDDESELGATDAEDEDLMDDDSQSSKFKKKSSNDLDDYIIEEVPEEVHDFP